ncbi:hypothetical protein L7F22_028765 [Adiantum nelumboides]|nr:hypothetical protein [Adiantum nelumboides]
MSTFGLSDELMTAPVNGVYNEGLVRILRDFLLAKYKKDDNLCCEIQEGLFLGSIGAAYNKDELEKRRITHVLSVANMIEAMYPSDFKYKKVEVRDSADVDLEEHFDDCFAFINEARQSGGAVLVHCFAGRSRSVTVVVAYLMKTYGMNFSEALDLVRTKRPQAAPNPGFILQLKNFERILSGEVLCTRACSP